MEGRERKTVTVRNVTIGEGMPKVCVPIVGSTKEEIIKEAEKVRHLPVDLVEWRADWFEQVFEDACVEEMLSILREKLGNLPLLFTFRSKREGGEKEIDVQTYVELNEAAVKTGCIDLVDAELFCGENSVRTIIETAHRNDVRVIVSNHDFEKTPEKSEIVNRLLTMRKIGADIPKIAVMPQKRADVLTLLAATEEVSETADCPIITMSMSGIGMISRLSGEVFGSAVTFGAGEKASAPGQIGAEDLKQILKILHG